MTTEGKTGLVTEGVIVADMSNSIRVWVSDTGTHIIPERLHRVRITRAGWPDKRNKADYADFMAWVKEVSRG